MNQEEFRPGVYRHYKGRTYLVLGVARHSETLEKMVVYIPLYENKNAKIWVRPLSMFIEDVDVDGESVPRFTFISST